MKKLIIVVILILIYTENHVYMFIKRFRIWTLNLTIQFIPYTNKSKGFILVSCEVSLTSLYVRGAVPPT